MGFFGVIGGLFKSVLGDSSSGGGTICCDNVTELEELKAKHKKELKRLENEKIQLLQKAQEEIIKARSDAKIIEEAAKAKGFTVVAQTIVALQERLNELGQRRMEIIEKSSLSAIKEMEAFYDDIAHKIQADNEEYNTKKLPVMLEILNKFEEGSAGYNLYFKRIDDDMAQQMYYVQLQMEMVARRQQQMLDSILESKEKIVEQTGAIAEKLMLELQSYQSNKCDNMLELNTEQVLAIGGGKENATRANETEISLK